MQQFAGPMKSWPGLEPYGRTVHLPQNDFDLFFYEAGQADPATTILLVHGLGDEADSWRYLVPGLAQNHRVLAPDLPGFGRSQRPPGSLSPDLLVAVLLELLDLLDVQRALLVGSSLGGVLCQQIALTHPKRASGLVLLNGTMVATGQALNLNLLLFMIPGIGEMLYSRLRRDPQAAYDTLRPYYANLGGLSQADRDFLFQRVNERVWSETQKRAYFSVLRQLALWSPRQQGALPRKLSRCQVPTLAIWGEQDAIISREAAERLIGLQATARLKSVPAAGHLPHQERPEAVLEAISADGRLLP